MVRIRDIPPKLIGAILLATFLSMLPAGYHLMAFNNSEAVIKAFVQYSWKTQFGYELGSIALTILWSFIVVCYFIGGFAGSFVGVPLSSKYGRRKTMMILSNGSLFAATLFFGLAKPMNIWEFLVFGRLLAGAYSGVVIVVVPLFVYECSPSEYRGALSCLVHTLLTLGCAVSAFLGTDDIWGTMQLWPLLLTFPAVFGVIQMCCYRCVKETPKRLHSLEPFSEAAVESVIFYHGVKCNPHRILQAFDDEEVATSVEELTFRKAMKNKFYKKRMMLGALVNFAQVFTGLMAIVSYSTVILTSLGVSYGLAQYVTALGCVLAVFLSLPALYLVEHVGRRPLLLTTLFALAFINLMLTIFGTLTDYDVGGIAIEIIFVFFIFLFLIAYNLGPGPIAYFISGELAPAACRTAFLATGMGCNWISTIVSVFLFYPLDAVIGALSFLIFVFPTFISACILYKTLPETKPGMENLTDETMPIYKSNYDADDPNEVPFEDDTSWSSKSDLNVNKNKNDKKKYGAL